jgi:hypothetical protein
MLKLRMAAVEQDLVRPAIDFSEGTSMNAALAERGLVTRHGAPCKTLIYRLSWKTELWWFHDGGQAMVIFEQYARRAEAIGRIGDEVRAEARATGTPISYTEPAYGTDVIREYPDGRRERLKADGTVVAIPARGR